MKKHTTLLIFLLLLLCFNSCKTKESINTTIKTFDQKSEVFSSRYNDSTYYSYTQGIPITILDTITKQTTIYRVDTIKQSRIIRSLTSDSITTKVDTILIQQKISQPSSSMSFWDRLREYAAYIFILFLILLLFKK